MNIRVVNKSSLCASVQVHKRRAHLFIHLNSFSTLSYFFFLFSLLFSFSSSVGLRFFFYSLNEPHFVFALFLYLTPSYVKCSFFLFVNTHSHTHTNTHHTPHTHNHFFLFYFSSFFIICCCDDSTFLVHVFIFILRCLTLFLSSFFLHIMRSNIMVTEAPSCTCFLYIFFTPFSFYFHFILFLFFPLRSTASTLSK